MVLQQLSLFSAGVAAGPNVKMLICFDRSGHPSALIVAERNIKMGEELLLDYGLLFNKPQWRAASLARLAALRESTIVVPAAPSSELQPVLPNSNGTSQHYSQQRVPSAALHQAAKPCKRCSKPAVAGNYGFCADHRDEQSGRRTVHATVPAPMSKTVQLPAAPTVSGASAAAVSGAAPGRPDAVLHAVQVPPGISGGQSFILRTATGDQFVVQAPAGACAGQIIQVQQPEQLPARTTADPTFATGDATFVTGDATFGDVTFVTGDAASGLESDTPLALHLIAQPVANLPSSEGLTIELD